MVVNLLLGAELAACLLGVGIPSLPSVRGAAAGQRLRLRWSLLMPQVYAGRPALSMGRPRFTRTEQSPLDLRERPGEGRASERRRSVRVRVWTNTDCSTTC